MRTLRLALGARTGEEMDAVLRPAAAMVAAGGLVAFPTETVYGLGANAFDAGAVARIFAAKQRPAWDPLIVHVSDEGMLAQVVEQVPPPARELMRRFWPGPLTLLLPRSGRIPDQVTAGRGLVGVRMPAHPVAARLIALAGVPVAAPSANRFGHVSPTTAAHVLEDLEGRIDAVIDAGPAVHGLESTVVDASRLPVTVYRPGALPLEAIRAAVGEAILYQPAPQNAAPAALPSPGVGIRHYAPRARLLLVEWPEGAGSEGEAGQIQRRQLQQRIEAEQKQPGKLGVLLAGTEAVDISPGVEVVRWGAPDGDEQARLEAMGSGLFAALRLLDSLGCDRILCPLPPDRGLGRAIRDRLLKAAREV